MDAGLLNQRVQLLNFTAAADGTSWSWAAGAAVWAKIETKTTRNIFSAVGLSAATVEATIRKRGVTLCSAFVWNGRHAFITDVNDDDTAYTVLTAALIEPVTAIRSVQTVTYNARNNPIPGAPVDCTFPAYLTEKYTGHTQNVPQAEITVTYVLVVPKAISAAVGDILTAGGLKYRVTAAHTLDPDKNEYEMTREADA